MGTPLAQADVSAHKQDVKITTPLLKTEKELESPAFKEQTPTGNTDTPLVPKDEQMENPKSPVLPPAFSGKKDEVPLVEPPAYKEQESPLEPIFKNESAVKKAIENRGKIPGNPISFSGNIGQGMPSQDLTGKADTRGEESLIPFDNKNMVLPGNPPSLLTGSTNGQAASCTTIIGYNTGLSSVGILLTMTQLEHSLTNKVIQESKFYYDQWLNAPPTQPPQSTFFLQTIKYTI